METTEKLLEKIVHRDNLNLAYRKARSNGGSPGIDGMAVEEALPYLKEHGRALTENLLADTYKPSPVRAVEIPKPKDGTRQLGIPTVIDHRPYDPTSHRPSHKPLL